MTYLLQEKVAIVTGGARGIGEATVRLLVERGAKVVIGDLLEAEGTMLSTELGDRAIFQKMDVTQQQDWNAAISMAATLGDLSILVNNAAIIVQATVVDTTEEQFMACVRVNQLGVFLGMRAVFPALKKMEVAR